jgi:FdhE protein
MTYDAWVERHPYLQPIAAMSAAVDRAAAQVSQPVDGEPDWQQYLEPFHAGTPLLQCEQAAIDLADPEVRVREMLDALLPASLPAGLGDQCREARADLDAHPALVRYLLWAVLARDLEPVITAFSAWRDEDRWLRNYCPTCGAAPAMGQLVGLTDGRQRRLSCGRCGTRWRYRRTGCPFCEPTDDHRLSVVSVKDEGGLRIDYCERCQGYLKTYEGQGHEQVMLADWTSLHLDLLARDRGLKRLAASLYEV